MTFSDLGSSFPLFEAPVSDAAKFVSNGLCSLCGKKHAVCFNVGIGARVVIECRSCRTPNGLDADDRVDGRCTCCSQAITFPPIPEEQILCCYNCLRSGKAAFTQDTELGMISFEHAMEGLTHGRPGLKTSEYELVPTESDWVRVRLPKEHMFELVRTPTYSTIQGERWQFCCGTPMIFLGAWSREEFSRRAPDGNGAKLFAEIVEDNVPGLWEDELHDCTGVYVFRCSKCQRRTAHWDIA